MQNVTEEIRKGIKLIFRPGDVVEVRSWLLTNGPRTIHVGRYLVGWDLVRAIEKEDQLGREVFYVLNPSGLPTMPTAPGRQGTGDKDVPHRKHFLLDFDPVRTSKHATEEQYQAALKQARGARDFMPAEWNVIMGSSGNGVHLLVPIDLPNDADSRELISRAQSSVAGKFTTAEVKVECFSDASRLVRAYGTFNKKSSDQANWRKSGILDC